MGCRVGITTDLETRKAHWKGKYPDMKNWEVLFSDLSKEQAQAKENKIASTDSCDSSPGGDNSDNENDKWHVYKFEF